MKTNEKREAVKLHVSEMIEQSYSHMLNKIEKALNSGAIDIDSWDEKHNAMLLPKAIVIAIMQSELGQYEGRGTSFEKSQKKQAANIRMFI